MAVELSRKGCRDRAVETRGCREGASREGAVEGSVEGGLYICTRLHTHMCIDVYICIQVYVDACHVHMDVQI